MTEPSKNIIYLILSGNVEEGRSDAVYNQDLELLVEPNNNAHNKLVTYVKILSNQVNTLTKLVHEYQKRIDVLEAKK